MKALWLSLMFLLILPWWPGGSRGIDGTKYPDRVAVINTLGGSSWYRENLRGAVAEWNRCDSRLHLVVDGDGRPAAYAPGTITVTRSDDGGAYGGWGGDHGVVFVGDGWTRTQTVLAHEVGHALGFGHGGTGIMGGGNVVTAVDCEGLRHYYGS